MRQTAERDNATSLEENKSAAKRGGKVAKEARKIYEKQTGQKVVSGTNFLHENKSKKMK